MFLILVPQDFPELPIGAEDSDSEDGEGVVLEAKHRKYELEVVEQVEDVVVNLQVK